jgi:hypothetical protein
MGCYRDDEGIALLLQADGCTGWACTRSAVTNAFDRIRLAPRLNGGVLSRFDPLDAMPPSPRCLRCGTLMWFSRLEPHPTDHATIDNFIFQCACGELLTQSLPR